MQILYSKPRVWAPAGLLRLSLPKAESMILRGNEDWSAPDKGCRPPQPGRADPTGSDAFSTHLALPGTPGLWAVGLGSLLPRGAYEQVGCAVAISPVPPPRGHSQGRGRGAKDTGLKSVSKFQKAILVFQLCESLDGWGVLSF